MKSEDLLYAIGAIESEAVLRAGERLEGKKPVPLMRHTVQVLLAAAVLLFALGGIGWYVYQSAIAARIPKKGETLSYHDVYYDETKEYEEEVQLSRAGLVVQVDAEPESRVCVFKAPSGDTLHTGRLNLHTVLRQNDLRDGIYTSFPPELRPGLEEGLRRTGVSEKAAGDLCFRWYKFEEDRAAPVLMAEIYNAYDLCHNDLILGMRDATVEIVSEPETEGIQRLEVRHHERLESNYLFQFDPELQYLLVICGDAEFYDFTALEDFADSLVIRQTDLSVAAREDPDRGWKLLISPDSWLPEAGSGEEGKK